MKLKKPFLLSFVFLLLFTSKPFGDENEGKFTDNINSNENNITDIEKVQRERDARDKVYDQITDITKIKPISGGPNLGDGSKYKKNKELSKFIESTWPSEGVVLYFPNREYRVSFNTEVDSRTFEGKVRIKETGEIAYGLRDDAPALFTRSEITKSSTKDVIGIIPPLNPGSYVFEFKVNKNSKNREEISGEINFTMADKILSQGAGNHRHGIYKFIFEEELFDITRGIIAFLFAIILLRWKNLLIVQSSILGLLSLFYMISFVLRNTDSILSTNEILARVDTWGFIGVLISFTAMILSKKDYEKKLILGFALLSAFLAEYSLTFLGGFITPIYMSIMVILGSYYMVELINNNRFEKLSIVTIIISILSVLYNNFILKFDNPPTGLVEHVQSIYIIIAVLVIITILKITTSIIFKNTSKLFNIIFKALLIIPAIYGISMISNSMVIL